MRISSHQVVFINTSPSKDRVQLLKTLQEINDMEDDCDEIYASGFIKRYMKRPPKPENLSLADWTAWYDSCGKPYIRPFHEFDIDNYPLETNADHNDDEYEESETIQKGRKRIKARIIRSVCFNKDVDSEKHYRELIMLFTSWKNETVDLIKNCSSYCQEKYLQVKNSMDEQIKQYAICCEHRNDIQELLNTIDDNYDLIAPRTQNIEGQNENEGTKDLHPELNATLKVIQYIVHLQYLHVNT